MAVVGLAIAGAATATYVAGAVTGAVIGGIVIGAIGAATIGAVAGAAVSMILSGALIDEPSNENFASFADGVLLNKRANSEPIPIIYGERLVGGIIVTLASHGRVSHGDGTKSANLYVVLVVSEGEIESYPRIFYDNKLYSGAFIQVIEYFGTETQEADPNMVSNLPQYTENHRLKGTAYLRLFMYPSNSAYPNGLPKITVEVKGIKLYDPRSGLTGWSDNPALCIRDYLTKKRYGRGIDTSLIDDESFTIAANYCDEYKLIDGRYIKPFRCNGVVATENSSLVILKKLLSSCRGLLIFSGGKYKLVIDKPEIAGFTFNEDNIIGGWSIALGSKNTKFNRIRANFFNKNKEWQADIAIADSPELRSSEDDGIVLERTIDLPYTDNLLSATVIAKINLNQSRQSISCDFTSTIEGLRVEVGDVVYISHETPGWTSKKFRVMKMALQNNDEVKITATEYSEGVYDFGSIQLTDDAPDTQLDDVSTILPPTDLTTVETLYTTINSSGVKSRLTVSWIEPISGFISHYDVEWKTSSDTQWQLIINSGTTTSVLNDISIAGAIDIRVRTVSTFNSKSEWLQQSNIPITGLEIPGNVENLSCSILNGTAFMSWGLSDSSAVRTNGEVIFRHSDALSGAEWGSSLPLSEVASGNSTSIVLPLKEGTYLAKFVDSSGNESIDSSSVVAEIVDIIDSNAVISVNQHPTFSGNRTNMVVNGSILQLATGQSAGTYEFDTYSDVGAVQVSRVSVHTDITSSIISTLFDDRISNFDDWDNFDTQSADAIADIYISTTNDDPAGAPVWSEWSKFAVADYNARAYKFKMEVVTKNINHQINVSGLSHTISMPNITEFGSGLTLTNIVFTKQFFLVPSISITPTDMQTGDYYQISNETSTGFTINFYNSTGSPISRAYNYTANGY